MKMYVYVFVGFRVLTAIVMKVSIFWYITRCGPLQVSGRFGGTSCLLHAGFLLELSFNTEDGGNVFLRNVC
jgi:hypothetical protein